MIDGAICFKPDNVYIGSAYFRYDGQLECTYHRLVDRRVYQKLCMISPPSCDSASYEISRLVNSFFVDKSSKLYISRKCRIPRDLIRNSGYKLAKDKEGADVIIVPDLKDYYYRLKFDFACRKKDESSIVLLSVNRTKDTSYHQCVADEYQKLVNHFSSRGNEILSDKIEENYASFLPNVPEYIDIAEQDTQKGYAFESTLAVDYPTTISVETLQIWKNYNDFNLLSKAIASSDYNEYPLTLCVFFRAYMRYIGRHMNDTKFNSILDYIGYNYNTWKPIGPGRVVTAKDWNMLQDLIMSEIGVSENGGYSEKKNIPEAFLPYIRKRFAVAPTRIQEPMLVDNLMETDR